MNVTTFVEDIGDILARSAGDSAATTIIQLTGLLLVSILLHVFAGWFGRLAVRLSNQVDTRVSFDKRKQRETLRNIVVALLRTIIWLVAVVLLLDILHVNVAAVATGAGFVGLVVGIGAQATIRDVLAGFFILLEGQYRVGDIVTISGGAAGNGISGKGTSGTVEEITLRITKLRGLDGTLSVVRNGEAAVVTNRTIDFAGVVIEVGVAYDSNIDTVERVMNELGSALAEDEQFATVTKEPIHFSRVTEFLDSSVVVRAIGKVAPAKQWEVEGAYRRQLLKAFKKANIDIPFPQFEVHSSSR